MDVKAIRISLCSSSSSSSSSSASSNNIQSDEDMMMNMDLLRRGPWTVEEDLTLTNYISKHGDGRWNSLARRAGLNRTGKSCRLRWLNYLRPDVRRGNITLEEQLVILELHSLWGNRWSKIAQHLPGRTDNEIKNYWRTRVQKHAKQLKCDVNSKQFKDTMRYLWMPRLVERIKSASVIKNDVVSVPPASPSNTLPYNNFQNVRQVILPNSSVIGNEFGVNDGYNNNNNNNNQSYNGTHNSGTVRSSDSFGTDDVTRVSDMTEPYSTTAIPIPVNYNNHNLDYNYQVCYPNTSQSGNYYNPGLELEAMELSNNKWIDYGDMSDNLWNVEDLLFLQQMNIMNTF